MNGSPLIVGLDIGTTKVCTLVGTLTDDQRVEVRGVGLAPSAGLRKGVIVDADATADAVRRSREAAEQASDLSLDGAHVYVGVTGDHVESLNCRGAVDIHRANDEIQPADVDRVKAAAANGVQTADRDVILERPHEFIVDGERGVRDPVHMTGHRLEVVMHVVTGEHAFLDNVRQCVERARLRVDSLVLESVATGEAVTTEQERELGCAVLDIGGGTTDMAVYLDGTLAHTAAIPVGGAHVTYDLSYGLEANYPLAEQLKLAHGCAVSELCDDDRVLDYENVRGETCQAEQRFLAEIAGPRMEELFELVRDELQRVGLRLDELGGGVVVTGGASRLTGTLEIARRVLGVTVRGGVPRDVVGHRELVDGPQYATAVGLVRIGALDQIRRLERIEESSFMGRLRTFWRRFTSIFD